MKRCVPETKLFQADTLARLTLNPSSSSPVAAQALLTDVAKEPRRDIADESYRIVLLRGFVTIIGMQVARMAAANGSDPDVVLWISVCPTLFGTRHEMGRITFRSVFSRLFVGCLVPYQTSIGRVPFRDD